MSGEHSALLLIRCKQRRIYRMSSFSEKITKPRVVFAFSFVERLFRTNPVHTVDIVKAHCLRKRQHIFLLRIRPRNLRHNLSLSKLRCHGVCQTEPKFRADRARCPVIHIEHVTALFLLPLLLQKRAIGSAYL